MGFSKTIKNGEKLQPHILVNNRADLDDYWGGYDFETPEQKIQNFGPKLMAKKFIGKPVQLFRVLGLLQRRKYMENKS